SSEYNTACPSESIGKETDRFLASVSALIPAIYQVSPCRRAKTTYLPGYPSRNTVSSHVVGTSFMKSITKLVYSDKLFGVTPKFCTGVWFNTVVANLKISLVLRIV